ncbi:MAG: sensor histidine kinase [Anaerolineae bacterium]|nr:sensor histidine kinase [Anaerolineae bacterium]
MSIDGLAWLLLGWLILALGLWLCGKVRRWLHRRRFGKPVDHEMLLVEHGRRLAGVLDQKTLAHILVTEVPDAFRTTRAILLLPAEYQLIDVMGGELRLPISHAAVRWVASGGEAQSTGRDRLRQLIEQGRANLGWTYVWVPLMRGTDLRGMWLLGARVGSLRYSPEDLGCLTNLGRQAAVILDAIHYAEGERLAAAEIRTLYHRVVAAQEVERGRLARDLHDIVLQDLCAVSRDLKALESQSQTNEELFGDLAARSSEAVRTLRGICHDLRPPMLQHDLATALKALIEQMDTGTRPSFNFQFTCAEVNLPDDVAVAVFRIAQEALRNAIRHADASEIEVRLTSYPDRLRLTVTDDGQGITGSLVPGRFVEQGHFGLAGMRERAAMIGGKLEVQTAPDYGTVVVLELPR